MTILLNTSFVLLFTLFYMVGGQNFKWIRRYLGPLLIPVRMWLYKLHRNPLRRTKRGVGSTISLILILSMGYGKNSSLMGIIKRFAGNHTETVVRLVYALLVVGCVLISNPTWTVLIIPIAFQIRAGGFKLPTGFPFYGKDFLFEDLFRASSIALSLVI